MVVTETGQVCPTCLIPLCNRLVHRDRQSTNSAVVLGLMTVMEADGEVVPHLDVAQVALRDQEGNPWFVLEQERQRVVHQPFERVALLGSVAVLGNHPSVVAAVARDDEVHVRVVEDVADTASQMVLALDDGERRAEAVDLHQLVVNGTRDEVAEKRKDQRIDVCVSLAELQELHRVTEEPLNTGEADDLVERVQPTNCGRIADFLDVPVACKDHCDSLRSDRIDVVDLVHLSSSAESVLHFHLSLEVNDLLDELLALPTLTLELRAELAFRHIHVDGRLDVLRQSHLTGVADDGATCDLAPDGDFRR